MSKPGHKVPLLEGCRVALDLFEHRTDFRWSFLSPPWLYRPGPGSGGYRLGVDYMLFDDDGVPAGIALPDLALAVADEVDNQALAHKHWTLAAPRRPTESHRGVRRHRDAAHRLKPTKRSARRRCS